MDMTTPTEAPWRSGLKGARANLAPGIALQLVALGLVIGYYHLPALHAALSRLVDFRQAAGLGFGVVSTGLFGGLLPLFYLRSSRRPGSAHRYTWTQGLVLTAFWAYKGVEVEYWYRLQAFVVGSGHDASTISIKVLLDQFLYCPLLAVPVTTAIYQAVDAGGDWGALVRDLRAPGWFRRRVLAVLISNAVVWIPAVAVIYALPTPLQLPLQNIVLCFYTLVVAHQMGPQTPGTGC